MPLTAYVRAAFWGGNERGYAGFPALEPASDASGRDHAAIPA
jgi:N-ethylmaleimide reductase